MADITTHIFRPDNIRFPAKPLSCYNTLMNHEVSTHLSDEKLKRPVGFKREVFNNSLLV